MLIFLSFVKSQELNLFPPNKEIVYSWQAELVTGTALPQSVSSRWNFSATLIVQQQADNFTVFKVSIIFNASKIFVSMVQHFIQNVCSKCE